MATQHKSAEQLRTALEGLAEALEGFSFWLPGPDLIRNERERSELVRSIREYLLPRHYDPDAPVVAVIVGPTGSGKSVLLNSLAEARASAPGAVRPTTLAPVVWTHRKHATRYREGFLAGLRGRRADVSVIADDDPLTEQLTVVDAPDFESVYPNSRAVGEEVLAVADLCIFVASALRYADAAAWSFLEQIRLRGLPILFVLNRLRTDPEERAMILSDFADMLRRRDLLLESDPSLIFDISEQVVYPRNGGLHPQAVEAIRRELALISDPKLRREVVRQSTEGAVAEVIDRAEGIAATVDADRAKVGALALSAEETYRREITGAADLVRNGGLVRVRPGMETTELLSELASSITRRAGVAARDTSAAWEADPNGRAILDKEQGLWRHGPDTPAEAKRVAEEWALELTNLMTLRGNLRRRRPGLRRELSNALIAAVVSPDSPPSEQLEGRFETSVLSEIIEGGAAGLEHRVQGVLEGDAERFRETASQVDLPEQLSVGIRRESARVSEKAGEYYGE